MNTIPHVPYCGQKPEIPQDFDVSSALFSLLPQGWEGVTDHEQSPTSWAYEPSPEKASAFQQWVAAVKSGVNNVARFAKRHAATATAVVAVSLSLCGVLSSCDTGLEGDFNFTWTKNYAKANLAEGLVFCDDGAISYPEKVHIMWWVYAHVRRVHNAWVAWSKDDACHYGEGYVTVMKEHQGKNIVFILEAENYPGEPFARELQE